MSEAAAYRVLSHNSTLRRSSVAVALTYRSSSSDQLDLVERSRRLLSSDQLDLMERSKRPEVVEVSQVLDNELQSDQQ